MTTADVPRPHSGIDVLKVPLLGRALRWRYGRLLLQIPFLIIAVALVYDGFFGPQQASRNLATIIPWVHYRGFVILALLLAGNLFCMGCPFTLPRTLAKKLSISGRRFPAWLRNKWVSIAMLFALFFVYEWLDLWASPALTAWVIVGYFVASFVLEAAFSGSPFCKYVCPLGIFNWTYATISPTQIGVHSQSICASCTGRECINGSFAPQKMTHTDTIPLSAIPVSMIPVLASPAQPLPAHPPTMQASPVGQTNLAAPVESIRREVVHSPQGTPGCGTELFAPQLRSNMDCIFCLDCVRACPHENASLFLRRPGRELGDENAHRQRWDVSFLMITLAFMGLTNAFGMVPPIFVLQEQIVLATGIRSEFIVLSAVFLLGNIVLPVVATMLAAVTSRALVPRRVSQKLLLRRIVAAFAPAFIPVGFAVWFAHYSFHFLTGPLTFIPVVQEFFGGKGEWAAYGASISTEVVTVIQIAVLLGGFLWSMALAQRAATRLFGRASFLGIVPWALLLLVLMLLAIQVFSLPMEMRGTGFIFG